MEGARIFDPLLDATRLSNDFEIRCLLEETEQALAEQNMVFDDHHFFWGAIYIFLYCH